MTRPKRGAAFAAIVTATWVAAATAHAGPQIDAGLTAAGCGLVHPERAAFGFCLGARSDLWLLRERDADWGVGAYFGVGTARFDDLRLGSGVSLLAPLWPVAPFVLSIGPAFEVTRAVPEVTVELLWGPASYNFHSAYAISDGVFVAVTRDVDSTSATLLSVGVRIDLMWFTLPFVVAYEGLSGGP